MLPLCAGRIAGYVARSNRAVPSRIIGFDVSICRLVSKRSVATALALLLACPTRVIAAGTPSIVPEIAWPGLPQDDLERMEAAAARLYEGRSIGTIERWRSPDTKNAGEVKLLRSFDSHGMPAGPSTT